jgi:hypothetical protein
MKHLPTLLCSISDQKYYNSSKLASTYVNMHKELLWSIRQLPNNYFGWLNKLYFVRGCLLVTMLFYILVLAIT